MRAVGIRVGLLIISTYLMACAAPDVQEVGRVTSPDGVVDVVITSRDVDATVPTPVEVHIVKHGESWDAETSILKGDKFEGLQATWRGPQQLEIRFDRGRVFSFTNFWAAQSVHDWKYNVHIRLLDRGPSIEGRP